MARAPVQPTASHPPRRARRTRSAGGPAFALGLAFSLALAAGDGRAAGARDADRAAVAAPNLRARIAYGYDHVAETSTVFVGPISTTALELDDEGGHAGELQLVGSLPLLPYVGLRAAARGGFSHARRSLDALEPGSARLEAYGAAAELFVRQAELGAFALGGAYDRLEGEHGQAADQLTGSADLRIFFPDLGSGPVDWFTRFEFRHREVEGDGQPFDVDADVWDVEGGARWYTSPDVAIALSGRWQRVEEEFLSEDDRTAGLGLHWLLPLPFRGASVELFAAGSVGDSELKQSPYRSDHRLAWGARAGLALRLFSGRSLVDVSRRYD